MIFERQAVEVVQGGLKLYLTYVTPNDLFANNFFQVETLEPKQSDGYQRILEPRRARRLARHLREAFHEGYANLPTTIFLATSQTVEYDPDTLTMRFETDVVCPFSVVDGQHRIEGLRDALRGEPELDEFKLPATIAVGLDETHQMYHFFVVNTTHKPVDKDLAQQITSRFTRMRGVKDMPYLPHWYRSQVDAGTDDKALRIAEHLNENPSSPLFGRIRMANDRSPRARRIAQATIVNNLKEHVLSGTNPISSEGDLDRTMGIFVNYLNAISRVFVGDSDPDETMVWTTSGIWFFLLISK